MRIFILKFSLVPFVLLFLYRLVVAALCIFEFIINSRVIRPLATIHEFLPATRLYLPTAYCNELFSYAKFHCEIFFGTFRFAVSLQVNCSILMHF